MVPGAMTRRHPPFKLSNFFYKCLLYFGLASAAAAAAAAKTGNDFGGDFSAGGLSGSTAPGPSAGAMGNKAASAMAIGTGASGPGKDTILPVTEINESGLFHFNHRRLRRRKLQDAQLHPVHQPGL